MPRARIDTRTSGSYDVFVSRAKLDELRSLPSKFRALPPAGRVGVSLIALLVLALIATAQRDLQQRPASEVRGSKLLWRLVCLNALGAAIYLRFGRRSA